ncbi:MAG: hypothetical protein AAGK14_12495 [Verrucomicrobiota bacterium]
MSASELPASVRAFAFADWRNQPGQDYGHPHDAWLESVQVRHRREQDDPQQVATEIEAEFLLSYHDQRLWLRYGRVRRYRLGEGGGQGPGGPGRDDWLEDDFSSVDAGHFRHRIRFASGAVWEIVFSEFEWRIDPA